MTYFKILGPSSIISESEVTEFSSAGGASGSSASKTGLITLPSPFGVSITILSFASKVDWVE